MVAHSINSLFDSLETGFFNEIEVRLVASKTQRSLSLHPPSPIVLGLQGVGCLNSSTHGFIAEAFTH